MILSGNSKNISVVSAKTEFCKLIYGSDVITLHNLVAFGYSIAARYPARILSAQNKENVEYSANF